MFNPFRNNHINYALIDQAIVSGSNFITGIIVARLIGIEGFGYFTMASLVVLFFNGLQQSLIISPMMTVGPQLEINKRSIYYASGAVLQFIFSLICSGFVWVVLSLTTILGFDSNLANLAFAAAFSTLSWQLQDYFRRYFFVIGKGSVSVTNDIVSYVGQILIILLASIFWQLNTQDIFYVMAMTSIFAVLIVIKEVKFSVVTKESILDAANCDWREGKWLVASNISLWFSGNYIFLLVGQILGASFVGAIRAAQNLLGITSIVILGLENVIPATAAKLRNENGNSYFFKFLRNIELAVIAFIGLYGCLVAFFSDYLMRVFYGGDYGTYGYIIYWLFPVYIGYGIGMVRRAGLRVLGVSAHIFYASLLSAVLVVIFGDYVIGLYGVVGGLCWILVSQISIQFWLIYSFEQIKKSSIQ